MAVSTSPSHGFFNSRNASSLLSLTITNKNNIKHTNNMPKKSNKTAATETNIETVTPVIAVSREDMDSVFQVNDKGYYDVHAIAHQWDASDVVNYVVSVVEEGQGAYQGAMRRGLLAIAAAIESAPEMYPDIKEGLAGKWEKQTVAGIMSCAKMLPIFKSAGVDLNKVRDIYALREVSKALKDAGDKDKPEKVTPAQKKIVAKLNKGEAPRKVKESLDAAAQSGEPEPETPEVSHDGSAAKETRRMALLKMAREVFKADYSEDAFAARKLVAEIAGCFRVNLSDGEIAPRYEEGIPEGTEEIPQE